MNVGISSKHPVDLNLQDQSFHVLASKIPNSVWTTSETPRSVAKELVESEAIWRSEREKAERQRRKTWIYVTSFCVMGLNMLREKDVGVVWRTVLS